MRADIARAERGERAHVLTQASATAAPAAALCRAAHALTGDWTGAVRPYAARRPDKTYQRFPRLPLPPPPPLPERLDEILLRRRSTRDFDDSYALPLETLSALLRWSAGPADGPGGGRRTYPSGGAYYPYEVYLLARRVRGLQPGYYHWHQPSHALERLPDGPPDVERAWAVAIEPRFRAAAAALVLTGDPERSFTKYGPRAYRFMLLSAGAILQNLYLVAEALGLAGTASGAPADQFLASALGLDGSGESVLVLYVVGRAGPESPWPEPWTWPPELVARDRGDQQALTLAVPPQTLHGIAWDDSAATRAAVRLVRGAERALGVRLLAALPADLAGLPPGAWPALPAIRRLAPVFGVELGPVRLEPDGPRAVAYRATVDGVPGHGVHVRDHAAAALAACGEALERRCWRAGVHPSRVVLASPAELRDRALDLATIAGYDRPVGVGDRGRDGWTPHARLAWVQAESLVGGRPVLVPVQLAAAPGLPLTDGEPELRPRTTNGVAAGTTRLDAVRRGLLEVVERDAFMLTWLCRATPARLAASSLSDPDCLRLLAEFDRARLRPTILELPTDVPACAVTVVLENLADEGPSLVFSGAADLDEERAVRKALLEAVQCWSQALRLWGGGQTRTASPVTRDGRILWWAAPGRRERLGWLFAGPERPVRSGPAGAGTFEELLDWFRRAGLEVLAVDLIDRRLAARVAWHVVAVIAPALHPLHLDERRPAFWSQRLESRLAGRPVNREPHPYP